MLTVKCTGRLSTTSVVSAGGNLGKCSDCERQDGLVALMKERMESKSKEVLRMVEERERGDHALLQARKELRQSRFRLTQVMQDLEKVKR